MHRGKIILYCDGYPIAVELYESKALRQSQIRQWKHKYPEGGYSIGIQPMTLNNVTLQPATVGYSITNRADDGAEK